MALGSELQFIVNLKMMSQGSSEIEKAASNLGKLEKSTQGLRAAGEKIKGFAKSQEDVGKAGEKLSEARANYEKVRVSLGQATAAQDAARVSLDAGKLKLGEINAQVKENIANYNAQQLAVSQAGLNYQNVTAQGAQVTGEIAQRLEDARAKLAAMGETLPRTSTEYQIQASAVRKLESEYATATKQSKAQSESALIRYKAEQAKLKELSQTVSKSSKEYKQQAAVVKKLQQEYKQSANDTRRFEAEQKSLAAAVEKAELRLAGEQEKSRTMAGELEKARINTKNLASEQERLSAAIAKSEKAQANYKALKEKLSFNNFKGDLVASYAGMKSLQIPVKVDMEFEQAMADVHAVMSDLTTEEFREMRSQAMELGSTTQFSSIQAAKTQETLARANFKKDEITNMLAPLMDMSAAEGMDLNMGAEILAGAVRGYSSMGYTSKDSRKLADILAYTSKSSNTSIAEIGEAFKEVAATAASSNIDPEKLGSYIGTLANQNMKGSTAGVALANAVMRLSTPNKAGREELARLKIARRTKGGDLVEIPEIIKQIYKKTEKAGTTGRIETFKKIFGEQGARAMIALGTGIMSGEQGTLEKGTYEERDGTAANMSKIRNDTLKGDIVSLGSAWEGLMINIGNALEPVNRFLTQTLTQGIQKVNEFMTQHETIAQWVVRIGAGLAGWKVISTVWTYGSALVRLPFAKIALSLAQGQVQAAALGASVQSTGGIFGGVFAAMKSAALGLWSVIAAHPFVAIGAAVTAAAVLIYQNWDKIKEYWTSLCDFCKNAWGKFTEFFSGWVVPNIFEPIGNFFSNAAGVCRNIFGGLSEYFSSWTMPDIFGGIVEIGRRYVSWLKDLWGGLFEFFTSWEIPNIFSPLIEKALGVIESLKAPFASFAEWISGIFSKLNPFNWELPSWLGGGTPERAEAKKSGAAKMAAWDPLSGNLPGFASGGIIDRPSIIQVAEAGREAIIPLTDKTRGVPLLMTAAAELGVFNENGGGGVNALQNGGGASNVRNFTGGAVSSLQNIFSGGGVSPVLNNFAGAGGVMAAIGSGLRMENRSESGRRNLIAGLMNVRNIFSGGGNSEMITSANEIISGENFLERKNEIDSLRSSNNFYGGSSDRISNRGDFSPVINISVDGGGSPNIGEDIARKVREVLSEMASYQERVAYA